ncbi:MAG TPA: acyl-CoA dehydrogenase family protein, partial [Mycobacterium sp.]|nr:acyl-CoA dehydrogenase family protein [Mycobacterium sp.]
GELGIGEVAVAYPGAPGQRVVLPAHRHATRLLWVPDHARDELTVIDLDTALDAPTVRGIDPAAGLLGLHERPAGILTELPGSAWPSALAAGRVALAHQLTGGARALLEMAVAHARHRTQFGAPLTAFQAVKHRLSDVLVAISAAESATVAAATAGTPVSAGVAKAMAGRAAAIAGRNCLQVFGGIGFTAEHDFHSYYRRSLVLDRLLGDRRTLERELGAQLRAGALANERIANLDDAPCVDLHSPGFGSP